MSDAARNQSRVLRLFLASMSPSSQQLWSQRQTQPVEPDQPHSDQDIALAILDEALTAAESMPVAAPVAQPVPEPQPAPVPAAEPSVLDQVLPQVATQPTPVPASGSAGAKERFVASADTASEYGVSSQAVEVEPPSPEISPEVAEYLQHVQDHENEAPQEVVFGPGQMDVVMQAAPAAQPVVIVPITQETEQLGLKKSPQFSIRWLVEWSKKVMKIFHGRTVYRPVEQPTSSAP